MPYQCLAEFLERLGHAGELARVEARVDPSGEVAEITRRVGRSAGPALLFGAVAGHGFPVLTNLLGSSSRISLALGVDDLAEVATRIAQIVRPTGPEGWVQKITTTPTRATLAKLPPRTVKTGACQQIVRLARDVNLEELPAPGCSPGDSSPAITAGRVFTRDAESGAEAVQRCDLAVLDRDRLAAGWFEHEEAARVLAGYRRRNEQMPLAVVLGGDPAGLLAAMAPLPPDADVSAVAGLLRQKPCDVVRCRSLDLEVPVDAELVIEGYVDPSEQPVELALASAPGGSSSNGRSVPAIHVTAMTHRANPVFPALVPGAPPDEFCAIGRALQQLFLPLVQAAVPELVAYDLPTFAAARRWASISIRKTYQGQVRRVAHALWGMPQWMFTKILVIVDEGVPLEDYRAVLAAVSTHVDPGRDVFFHEGPSDPLDPAAPADALSFRMAIDATAKPRRGCAAGQPELSDVAGEIRETVAQRWLEYGLGPDPEAPPDP